MFSQGQWIFAALFLLTFIIAAVFVYRKDAVMHKTFYKGSYKVLIAFLLFVAFLFFVKVYMKR
jgi:hypothetical protein